ncbi:Uncharacterised protein [Kluyvera cryocrescens]|uniref:Uncharacterized protein n=1 Tax=Kluyvera cryocrescens TaxID=580 RepID=A0A485B4U6_KLUCR|nr:Uncharacterised protein [Kluyvera cryocrescens]
MCENSATISTYLYLTLQVLFPELHFTQMLSRREFERFTGHYDVVFATTHLNTSKMVFVVNPSIGAIHKSAFRNHVISALQGVDPNIIQIEQLLLIFERFGNIIDHQGLQRALASYIYAENSPASSVGSFEPPTPSLIDLLGESARQVCCRAAGFMAAGNYPGVSFIVAKRGHRTALRENYAQQNR